MKEIVHICCSYSAVGGMKYAIKEGFIEGKKVIGLADDLSNGPIDDINNVNRRFDWLKKIYMEEVNEISEVIKDDSKSFIKDIMKINDEIIYIWYANNPNEICVLLHILSMIKEKIHNLYTINVSEITYNTGKINEYTPRAGGEVIPEKLGEFIEIRKPMDFDRYTNLMKLWAKLRSENSNLRVYEDNEIKSVNVDYFDNMILLYTYSKFMNSARIVGEVIGKSESYISNNFIFWRVTELIKNGKIISIGNLAIMRELKIKKV